MEKYCTFAKIYGTKEFYFTIYSSDANLFYD